MGKAQSEFRPDRLHSNGHLGLDEVALCYRRQGSGRCGAGRLRAQLTHRPRPMSTRQHQLLCLSCASSPPPKGDAKPFMTDCCSRPICADCLARTPRLRDYNPCLACLAGVSVVKGPAAKTKDGIIRTTPQTQMQQRETEMFALGADSDESDDDAGRELLQSPPSDSATTHSPTAAPETLLTALGGQTTSVEATEFAALKHTPATHPTRSATATYYIQRGDTIQGLSLKFGVAVCLPSSLSSCEADPLPLPGY